jgi:hypothetical protein
LTIVGYQASVKHLPPQLLTRCVEGLRKAGLPEQ